jgi:anaerobic magnesium-protoporphyrin IX monomethyl ester cyclase
MTISFVNGPFLKGFSRESRSPAVTKSGTLYYPAWLAYACGMASEQGIKSYLVDCIADKLEYQESINKIKNQSPKLVVIGTSTPSIEADAAFALDLKREIDCKVCMVGTHVSSTAEETLALYNHVDFIARREYDLTIIELYNNIQREDNYINILGLSYRKNDEINHNKDRPYIDDLDTIPFASKIYKEHLNIKNYYYGHVKYPMISIFTSRGCNAKCTYCVYPQTMFGKFRSRSPENIASEFEWIGANLPEVKEVLIDDDTFTMYDDHAEKVAEELIRVKNKIPWTCESRANLSFETLRKMKLAGCRLIVVGFESIDQNVLNNVKKGIKQSKVDKFVEDAKKARIKIHGCFMAGNPGDTMDSLHASLDWAIIKNFDTAQFFPLQLYPGTTAYVEQKQAGRLKEQPYRMWITEIGMHNMTLKQSDTGLSESEIVSFCNFARRKFYLRKGYILRKLMDIVIDPYEFKKNIKGFINIRKHLLSKNA